MAEFIVVNDSLESCKKKKKKKKKTKAENFGLSPNYL